MDPTRLLRSTSHGDVRNYFHDSAQNWFDRSKFRGSCSTPAHGGFGDWRFFRLVNETLFANTEVGISNGIVRLYSPRELRSIATVVLKLVPDELAWASDERVEGIREHFRRWVEDNKKFFEPLTPEYEKAFSALEKSVERIESEAQSRNQLKQSLEEDDVADSFDRLPERSF